MRCLVKIWRIFVYCLLVIPLISLPTSADEGLLISSYDHKIQTSLLDKFLEAIAADIEKNGELSQSTKEMIRHNYKSRKIVQEGFLAGSSRDSRKKTIEWARSQFQDAQKMLEKLEGTGGDKTKIALWREELSKLLSSAENTQPPTDLLRSLVSRAYSIVQEIHTALKEKDPKALLPVMRTVEPSAFLFSLDQMEPAENRIRDFFLHKWKPSAGSPISMNARERLARLSTDMYFLHHYPVRDDSGSRLQGVFDRMNEVLKKDELLRVAHQLRETQEKLDEFRDSKEPMCLDPNKTSSDGVDSLAPEFIVDGNAPLPKNLPSYCQAIDARGMSSCFKGKDTSKRIVIDPGHLGGAFTRDDRDHQGYREGLSNFMSANLLRLLLSQCMGYDKKNIILTRHDVMYKDEAKTNASAAAGEQIRRGLNHAFYERSRASGKSCSEQIGFARKEIGKGYGDYAVFRETPKGVPTLIIEGFSHAPENPRRDLVEAFNDSEAQGKYRTRLHQWQVV
jgi:hypothetical protein